MKFKPAILIMMALCAAACATTSRDADMKRVHELRAEYQTLEESREDATLAEAQRIDYRIQVVMQHLVDLENRLGIPHSLEAPKSGPVPAK
tara:strand:- start:5379 stop:5651 length:273 start_codon:yes stop_codon:yes gene_type:complete